MLELALPDSPFTDRKMDRIVCMYRALIVLLKIKQPAIRKPKLPMGQIVISDSKVGCYRVFYENQHFA
jgi:hypothetical protein